MPIQETIDARSKMDIKKIKQVLTMLSRDKNATAHKIAATLNLVHGLCEVIAEQECCQQLTSKMRKESRQLLSAS